MTSSSVMPSLSIIMPCYNRAYDLHKVLEAYDRQAGDDPFEIIAVDDGSSDSTYQVLSSYQPRRYKLYPVKLRRNQGPANARNQGIALAQAPVILIVGDDILPDAYLVRGHLAAHRRYPQKEITILGNIRWPRDLPVNTLMRHIDGIGAQQFSYHYFKDGQEYDYRHFYTANISIKRDFLLSEPQLFDTNFPYAAFEDVELSYRLSRRGMQIIYLAFPVAFHYHYHTIWTFSQRQFKSGLMASLLIERHPEVKNRILGKNWPRRLRQIRLQGKLNRYPDGMVEKLETESLHLLNIYEWTPHQKLDQAYLTVLRYFFVKGLLQGFLKDDSERQKAQNAYADKFLRPLLNEFK